MEVDWGMRLMTCIEILNLTVGFEDASKSIISPGYLIFGYHCHITFSCAS